MTKFHRTHLTVCFFKKHFFYFFKFYFIFKLYNIVLVLPYIKMNLPQALIFLKRPLVFPMLLFFSTSLHCSFKKVFFPCYSLELCIQFGVSFPFSLAFLLSFPQLCKASSDDITLHFCAYIGGSKLYLMCQIQLTTCFCKNFTKIIPMCLHTVYVCFHPAIAELNSIPASIP